MAVAPPACTGAAMPDVPDALRQRFVGGLGQRWQAISQASAPDGCIQALHRLAGAAGSYGFDAMGQAARRAELSCAGSADGWPAPAALAELQHCIVAAGGVADDTTR